MGWVDILWGPVLRLWCGGWEGTGGLAGHPINECSVIRDTFADTWVQGGPAAVHVERPRRGVHHREGGHRS